MTPLLLAIPLLLAAPVPKDFKPALALDGQWKVTEFERNGKPASHFQELWRIDGDCQTITHAAAPNLQPRRQKLRIDLKAKPMEFDYTFEVNRRTYSVSGVIAGQGDDFVVCFPLFADRQRPDNLVGGEGTLRYTLTRVKDKPPAAPEDRR